MCHRPSEEDKEALALAALAYRGFWLASPSDPGELARELDKELTHLPTLRGWRLRWGPATFRFLGSLFDDALMFLVQKEETGRLAIVIRGTNPLALNDWLLFDFLARRQVPWRPGGRPVAPGAETSLSTALGLWALLAMRGPLWSPRGDRVRRGALREAPPWSALGRTLLDRGAHRAGRVAARSLWSALTLAERPFVELHDAALRPQNPRLGAAQGRGRQALESLLGRLEDFTLGALVPLLDWEVSWQPLGWDDGPTLVEALRDLTASAGGPLELLVTGHSKGGALAQALAAHLNDTRELGEPWTAGQEVSLRCAAFAGPTPGNRAFAEHVDATLGERCLRVANRLDIVPHTWNPEDLAEVPGLYDLELLERSALQALVDRVIQDVGSLGYRHTERCVDLFDGQLGGQPPGLVLCAVLHHVEAYLVHYGLEDEIDLFRLVEGLGAQLRDEWRPVAHVAPLLGALRARRPLRRAVRSSE